MASLSAKTAAFLDMGFAQDLDGQKPLRGLTGAFNVSFDNVATTLSNNGPSLQNG